MMSMINEKSFIRKVPLKPKKRDQTEKDWKIA